MFDWLKRRAEIATSNAMATDLQRFIQMLKGASDSEIGFMLVIANIIRINLTRMGKIPPAALDLSILRDEDTEYKCYMCPITLRSAIKQFQKLNQQSDAAGTMVWLHSARALLTPEIRVLGRQMWAELSRGFPYVDQALDDFRITSPKPLPENIEDEIRFIPKGLEPL